MATSGRSESYLTISFNICTITCAVASYVHYMISFHMCRHSCAKFVIWLQMPFINVHFFTLLLVLRIQHVILVSGLCQYRWSAVSSSFHRIVWLSHMLEDAWLQVLDADLGWGNYCASENVDWLSLHLFRWLRFITVFAVPSCSPRWIHQSTGARPWFLWTLCAHLFSNDNSSCLGSYGHFKLAFFRLQYSRWFHLQYSGLQWTLVHEGASWLW